uniref:NADH-ubiquinone oxidoreductase chain 6 n=1 Tax=Orthotomicus laricis TaxID=102854 RepID=A0A2D0VPF8_9CUCU|nr:NADH dehydrogenase subunit 6 [Orthotomicus laricis]AOY40199.1 NADH dehydrogenase subunit 6 [Orthotomicus laricis]
MLSLIILLSWTFIFLKHPLALGGILFMQTVLTALASGNFYLNFWYSYLLFLIMISGMLILFMYMTSIASNEKFAIPNYWKIMGSMSMLLLTSTLSIFLLNDIFNIKFNTSINFFLQFSNTFKPWTLSKFFADPFYQIIILLMIYLFITLIMSVKITGKIYGPLRQKSS